MPQYGLIGWPLGHSFSKQYFTEKFEREGIHDAHYELFPLENISGLPDLLRKNPGLAGLNVTIPFKQSVIPFLHQMDNTARTAAAVNCIKIIKNQYLVGYNTDVVGFEKSLMSQLNKKETGHSALILGTGGASKAVAFVFHKLGIPCKLVSRHPKHENEISYDAIPLFSPSIVVNTTPLGTFPEVDEMPPFPLEFLSARMLVYDLIYNPGETLLLREAKARGCTVKNGLEMLELQAEAAWQIWQRDQ